MRGGMGQMPEGTPLKAGSAGRFGKESLWTQTEKTLPYRPLRPWCAHDAPVGASSRSWHVDWGVPQRDPRAPRKRGKKESARCSGCSRF